MDKENLMFILCMLAFAVLGFSMHGTYLEYKDSFNTKILNYVDGKNSTFNCSGLSIIPASKCLGDEMATWFRYNMSNHKKDLTLDKLKEEGGVCWHYADWYKTQAESLGYITKEVIIDTDNETAHQFTVISNREAYCVLDQLDIYCFQFWINSTEEKNETKNA